MCSYSRTILYSLKISLVKWDFKNHLIHYILCPFVKAWHSIKIECVCVSMVCCVNVIQWLNLKISVFELRKTMNYLFLNTECFTYLSLVKLKQLRQNVLSKMYYRIWKVTIIIDIKCRTNTSVFLFLAIKSRLSSCMLVTCTTDSHHVFWKGH